MRSIKGHLYLAVGVGLVWVGGAAAFVLPAVRTVDVERTRTRLVDVADTAQMVRNDSATCPSPSDLVREELYPEPPRDPWGGRLEIRCDGDRVVAVSAGPDRRAGTKDDIRR